MTILDACQRSWRDAARTEDEVARWSFGGASDSGSSGPSTGVCRMSTAKSADGAVIGQDLSHPSLSHRLRRLGPLLHSHLDRHPHLRVGQSALSERSQYNKHIATVGLPVDCRAGADVGSHRRRASISSVGLKPGADFDLQLNGHGRGFGQLSGSALARRRGRLHRHARRRRRCRRRQCGWCWYLARQPHNSHAGDDIDL